MNAKLLITAVAIGALAAGGASAKIRHHRTHATEHGTSFTYAAPAQPIPYAEVDHYLKASRAERKSIEMAAAANTGSVANTSASTTASAGASADTSQSAAPMTQPAAPAAAPPENSMTPPASSSSATPSEPAAPPANTTTPPPSSPQ